MARASTVTKLPLLRWAELMGIHPFHFAQLYSDTYMPSNTCGMAWFQYSWQNADRISREEIAIAIRDAEDLIEGYIGYHLLPTWDTHERVYFDRPALRELFNLNGRNVRGQMVSVSSRWGHVISGGVRVKTGIETANVTRSDADGDGYSELCTVTVSTSVEDANEIKVYYPGESGADEWEIRPITVVLDTAADTATITFKSWQIIDPDLQEDINPDAINADTNGNYLTTVDVYRVYNDPQTQVSFVWELDTLQYTTCANSTCAACTLGTQTGCMHLRDARLGIVVPSPATWDASDQAFDLANYSVCRAPDQAYLHYFSGNRDRNLSRSSCDMERYWETAVAFLAASMLQKPSCGCDNVSTFIQHWQEMREFSSRESGTYFQTQSQLTNPLGSTNGAKYAYEKARKPGRKLGR